jgi:hypothetical protein
MRELAKLYPGILTPYVAGVKRRGGPTSLLSLAPNPVLNRIASLPIRVPFHNIMGDRGLGGGPESSDGVIPYSSSHLEGAESELIVPTTHTVFSNDDAVNEIKRILHENVDKSAVNAEILLRQGYGGQVAVSPYRFLHSRSSRSVHSMPHVCQLALTL